MRHRQGSHLNTILTVSNIEPFVNVGYEEFASAMKELGLAEANEYSGCDRMVAYRRMLAYLRENPEAKSWRLTSCNRLHGRTLLHCACSIGNVEAVRALVESGADVNAQDAQFHTPLVYATNYINYDDKTCIEGDDYITNRPSDIAIAKQMLEILLTARNVNVDENIGVYNGRNTVLHQAVVMDRPEILGMLLDKSNNHNARGTAILSATGADCTEGRRFEGTITELAKEFSRDECFDVINSKASWLGVCRRNSQSVVSNCRVM